MNSFAPVNEKEFETAGLFLFGGLSLIMAILKLVNWNSPLAKPSRKGDKFIDHTRIAFKIFAVVMKRSIHSKKTVVL
jgi:hypothetical protein